uniref:Methyltransferase FkbM domain-containing protein n=1 Tax=Ditylenchus dipsaci TaxID=166011 RepID=A0A915CLZ9_9BILA
MNVASWTQILNKIEIGNKLVHYLAIDIEGNEYPLLNELHDFGQYQGNGIFICQLDVEFHTENLNIVFDKDFGLGKFLVNFFHKATSFLPVYAAPYSIRAPHAIKMTIINVKSVECEKAFRFSKYFER